MPRKSLRVGVWIPAGIALVLLLLAWDVNRWVPIPRIRGNIEARLDVKHGRYQELGYGLPVPWRPRYETLLRQRYGVEFEALAGCVVSKSLVDYVAAYNEVSMDAADRKFGHDIFKEVSDEAEKEWERQHESSLKR